MKCLGTTLNYRHQFSMLIETLDAGGKFVAAQDAAVSSRVRPQMPLVTVAWWQAETATSC